MVFAKAAEFLGNVRSELGKVVWPGKKETYASTTVVVILVVVVAVFLWLVDLGISGVIRRLLS